MATLGSGAAALWSRRPHRLRLGPTTGLGGWPRSAGGDLRVYRSGAGLSREPAPDGQAVRLTGLPSVRLTLWSTEVGRSWSTALSCGDTTPWGDSEPVWPPSPRRLANSTNAHPAG